MENKTYVGSIGNGATQNVKAPLKNKTPRGKSVVKKGGDLRTGKGK